MQKHQFQKMEFKVEHRVKNLSGKM